MIIKKLVKKLVDLLEKYQKTFFLNKVNLIIYDQMIKKQ